MELFTKSDDFKSASGGYQWRTIASYGVKGSASGAMKGLRDYFGRDGSGFEFTTRAVNGRTVLFAKFDPTNRKPDFEVPGNVPVPAVKSRPKVETTKATETTQAEGKSPKTGNGK